MARRDPEQSTNTPGVVRHVSFAVGEGKEQRWGWEGLDIGGQVVTASKATFKTESAALDAATGQEAAPPEAED